jgi:hypothetical protein
VNPTPAVIISAPAPSTAETAPTLERHVGERVAAAALTLAEALAERQDGGLTRATKMRGGDLIGELFGLRQHMVGFWDFDALAKEHGAAVLRAADVSPATADCLVDEVLAILHKVVRAALN